MEESVRQLEQQKAARKLAESGATASTAPPELNPAPEYESNSE